MIEDIGEVIEEALRGVEGTASVFSERVDGGRYLKIKIDRLRAARIGLNIKDVQEIISTAIGGMNVTETVEGLERYSGEYPLSTRHSR